MLFLLRHLAISVAAVVVAVGAIADHVSVQQRRRCPWATDSPFATHISRKIFVFGGRYGKGGAIVPRQAEAEQTGNERIPGRRTGGRGGRVGHGLGRARRRRLGAQRASAL